MLISISKNRYIYGCRVIPPGIIPTLLLSHISFFVRICRSRSCALSSIAPSASYVLHQTSEYNTWTRGRAIQCKRTDPGTKEDRSKNRTARNVLWIRGWVFFFICLSNIIGPNPTTTYYWQIPCRCSAMLSRTDIFR